MEHPGLKLRLAAAVCVDAIGPAEPRNLSNDILTRSRGTAEPGSTTPAGAGEPTSGRVVPMTQRLNRFIDAQDRGGRYEAALSELRAGRKRSHWMWFVFPQVSGLGRSDTARFYALSGLDEARDYLADPVLGPRLIECAVALLSLPGSDPVAVMGGTDALKLRSCMTLFVHASDDRGGATFEAVLDKYFAGAEDEATLSRI